MPSVVPRTKMISSLDVTIIVFVIVADLVDHLDGLLGGGTVVEPYEVVAVHLLMEHGEVLLDLLRVQRVSLLVVQVAQLLRLWDSDAEAVILRHRLHRTARIVSVAEVRKVAIAASTCQKLFESRFQLLKMQVFIREYTLTNLPGLFRAILLGEIAQECQSTTVLSRKTIDIC